MGRKAGLYVMGVLYMFAGIMHFVNPSFYVQMMPSYLPWHLALVYLSGVAELVLGAALLVPGTRELAAWGIIALLIAVFPANLNMAMNNLAIQGGPAFLENPSPVGLWLRLPLQLVLIWWAWLYTRPADE